MPMAIQVVDGTPPRGCLNKVRHLTLDEAQEALINFTAGIRDGTYERRNNYGNRPLEIYRCDHCHYYHIGHRPFSKIKRTTT